MSAKDQFFAEVEKKVSEGLSREKAIAAVVHENPRLHHAMLEEVNQRTLSER